MNSVHDVLRCGGVLQSFTRSYRKLLNAVSIAEGVKRSHPKPIHSEILSNPSMRTRQLFVVEEPLYFSWEVFEVFVGLIDWLEIRDHKLRQ